MSFGVLLERPRGGSIRGREEGVLWFMCVRQARSTVAGAFSEYDIEFARTTGHARAGGPIGRVLEFALISLDRVQYYLYLNVHNSVVHVKHCPWNLIYSS